MASKYVPEPGKVVVVSSIPSCDFCQLWLNEQMPGPYDFKTSEGPWAHGCAIHWRGLRKYTTLGVGKGQLWITADQVK